MPHLNYVSGEVVHRTAQKAYADYAYKTRDKSKDKEKADKKRHIRQWMKEHKGFVRAMDDTAFQILKAPGDQTTNLMLSKSRICLKNGV